MIYQDRWSGSIAEIEVTQQIILQGGPAIQTTFSQKGHVLAWGQLWNDR
jgi:hypothetical protein